MPHFDLWLDGDWGEESIAWTTPVVMHLDRLLDDPVYGQLIYNHIQNTLDRLAKEIHEIGIARPYLETGVR